MSYTKKLLASSALAFAGFSQLALGSQTLTETLSSESHVKHVHQQEYQPLSVWGVCSSFVTSFFEPFIQDGPKALVALKEQQRGIS